MSSILSQELQNSDLAGEPGCDLCGSKTPLKVLTSSSLDGPLVRCSVCGLHYVSKRASNLSFGEEPSSLTAARIREVNLRYKELPREEEKRLNELNARWRLELIQKFIPGGRLLEIGCGRGDFLKVARDSFEVRGVEPSPELAADAKKQAEVYQGLVEDSEWFDFDVAASFHVLEHVGSPKEFVGEINRRMKPGGFFAVETPDIDSLPYHLLKGRWRQLIPEHYYFFDRKTLVRLLTEEGFEVHRIMRIGKYVSLPFLLNRIGRYLPFNICSDLRFGKTFTFRVNPMDIILALAIKK